MSTLGSQTATLALPLLTLAVTGSPTWAGALGFAAGVPALALQLPAGVLVDRWDRRRVMIGCDLGRLLLTASIPLAGLLIGLSVAQLFVVAVGNASLRVLFSLAQSSALPHVVAPPRLGRAVARTQASTQGATLAGQPLGGWLYSIAAPAPFVVDAVSFAVSALTLTWLRTELNPRPNDPDSDPDGTRRLDLARGARARLRVLGRELKEGGAYLWGQPVLRALALLGAVTTLTSGGFTLVVIVLLARLGAAPTQIGVIFGGCGAAGLVGAALTPRLVTRLGAGRCYLASLAVSAALAGLFTITHSPLTAGLCAAGIVGVGPLAGVVLYLARAHTIPTHLFGRVRALETTITTSTGPLSSLLTGLALSRLGPGPTCAVIATGLASVTAIAALNPHIRRLTSHQPATPEAETTDTTGPRPRS